MVVCRLGELAIRDQDGRTFGPLVRTERQLRILPRSDEGGGQLGGLPPGLVVFSVGASSAGCASEGAVEPAPSSSRCA